MNNFRKPLSSSKQLFQITRAKLPSRMLTEGSKEAEVEAAVDKVDEWGGVDVMFNNAGIMHPKDGDAEECRMTYGT